MSSIEVKLNYNENPSESILNKLDTKVKSIIEEEGGINEDGYLLRISIKSYIEESADDEEQIRIVFNIQNILSGKKEVYAYLFGYSGINIIYNNLIRDNNFINRLEELGKSIPFGLDISDLNKIDGSAKFISKPIDGDNYDRLHLIVDGNEISLRRLKYDRDITTYSPQEMGIRRKELSDFLYHAFDLPK
jgi:hypothetical protein